MPKTTVIVPYIEKSQPISDCLNSLRQQTYHDFDVIVVRKKGLDPVLVDDLNITHIEAAIQSDADAINLAVMRSSSEVYGFCRACDTWAPRKLKSHMDHLKEMPDVGISFAGADLVLPSDQEGLWQHNPRLISISGAYILKHNPMLAISTCVARREALEDSMILTDAEEGCVLDPALLHTMMIDFGVRVLTRTDWLIEGVADRLATIDLRSALFGKAQGPHMAEWKSYIKSRAPAAPAFFARHAGVARKSYAMGLGAYLDPISQSVAPFRHDIIGKTFSDAIKADFAPSPAPSAEPKASSPAPNHQKQS